MNTILDICSAVIIPIIKNGDIELLKSIDFTKFTKEDIYSFVNDYMVTSKREEKTHHKQKSKGEIECLKFLTEKLGNDYEHKTNDYYLCHHCRYYGVLIRNETHRIKIDENGERIILCEQLREIITNENMNTQA